MRNPLALIAGLALGLMASLGFAQTRPAFEASATQPAPAAIVVLHGPINDYSRSVFIRDFGQARQAGARTVIVDLNTYGGTVKAGLEISHFIKQQRDIRTIAFVNNKAISAGAMIALACDEIVMVPYGGTLGDCAPIAVDSMGQLQPLPAAERAKSESPILADFRESANLNGYNELLALAMVSVDRTVYWVKNEPGAERRFVDEATYKELTGKGWKAVENVPEPVDGANTLLTVDGKLARELGLAKGLAGSREELLAQRNLSAIAVFERGTGEAIVSFLNDSMVRAVLLSVFLTSLYIALHSPGHGFAEVIALVALGGLVGVPLLTGYAQWWEIVMILAGMTLLALELFVIPGFGIAGFGGIALMIAGLLMTFVAPEPGRLPFAIPRLPITWGYLQNGLMALVTGMSISLLLSWWLRRYLPRLPYFNKLILTTNVGGSAAAMVGSLTNIDPMEAVPALGATGKAVTDLRPGGSAEFIDPAGGSHIVSVVSDSGFVLRGTPLTVREVGGSRIVVRPVAGNREMV